MQLSDSQKLLATYIQHNFTTLTINCVRDYSRNPSESCHHANVSWSLGMVKGQVPDHMVIFFISRLSEYPKFLTLDK